MNDYLAEE